MNMLQLQDILDRISIINEDISHSKKEFYDNFAIELESSELSNVSFDKSYQSLVYRSNSSARYIDFTDSESIQITRQRLQI